MASISPESIESWKANRIIQFFNKAKSIAEITRTIKDDPSDGEGHALGRTVARRILQKRDRLGWRRFQSLDQIYEVDGMGPDKLEDLVYSLGIPAAEAFVNSMYESGVIYRENWPLIYHSRHVESYEDFETLAFDEGKFRAFVADQMEDFCKEQDVDQKTCNGMVEGIKTAYIDSYNNSSSDYPTYELAQWFYGIDQGNFFFFESGIPETRKYFEYHPGNPWEMELRMFKGVTPLLIKGGIIPDDLAVVVNYPEQVITLWSTALFD